MSRNVKDIIPKISKELKDTVATDRIMRVMNEKFEEYDATVKVDALRHTINSHYLYKQKIYNIFYMHIKNDLEYPKRVSEKRDWVVKMLVFYFIYCDKLDNYFDLEEEELEVLRNASKGIFKATRV